MAARQTNTAGGRWVIGNAGCLACAVDFPSFLALFVAPEGSMTTTTSRPSNDLFISAAEAIRRHQGLNRQKLYHLGLTQAIRVCLLPGVPPRYSAADLDRLMSAPADERR